MAAKQHQGCQCCQFCWDLEVATHWSGQLFDQVFDRDQAADVVMAGQADCQPLQARQLQQRRVILEVIQVQLQLLELSVRLE
jgi:hypothetical protein